MSIEKLKIALEIFIKKQDRSIHWAKSVETIIDETDGEFDELIEHLASYQPGGGEFLYNESEMEIVCKKILKQICD